jgi:hypothetical protein
LALERIETHAKQFCAYEILYRNIIQKRFTVNKKAYIAFLNLLKAFDKVNWNIMIKILKTIKIA